jgi:hypothetical protein
MDWVINNHLETPTDQLVYRLYDLTEDEIAIIESSSGSAKNNLQTTNQGASVTGNRIL